MPRRRNMAVQLCKTMPTNNTASKLKVMQHCATATHSIHIICDTHSGSLSKPRRNAVGTNPTSMSNRRSTFITNHALSPSTSLYVFGFWSVAVYRSEHNGMIICSNTAATGTSMEPSGRAFTRCSNFGATSAAHDKNGKAATSSCSCPHSRGSRMHLLLKSRPTRVAARRMRKTDQSSGSMIQQAISSCLREAWSRIRERASRVSER
mmetsp:Transcript_24640/g.70744  ORF Transcript_24640/g.70744 Transcript_24640/m.70744 type:complete len:207 (+) Transcript_24640:850-1470(+)